ncbi:MAG: phospholipid/cholesterol/gamma-HCH transport system substrate-binding protein [Solirubrobacteraceae bacterium]|nr:phospholipid/cholesterol/gamma-HCH transport system substrate-binding protein [Solirubrobacteraceae bacterium]
MRRRRAPDHLALGLLVALLAAVLTYLSTAAIDGSPFDGARTARIVVPARGPILKPGDDVRVAGVRVGEVRDVTLEAQGAVATLTLGNVVLRRDAAARVQPRGLAGAVDVDLDPGKAGASLPAGALVRSARAGTQLTDVIAGFDAATRRALARTVQTFGAGLAGRGDGLNRTLGNLAPALDSATPLLRALRPQPGALGDLIVQADRFAAALPAPDLGGLLAAAAPVATTLTARDGALAATIDATPGLEAQAARTLPAADALLDRLRPTLAVLTPGVRSLAAALPDLQAVEARGNGLDALARIGRAGAPVLRAATPVVASLYPSAASLAALAPPVAQLVSYLLPYGTELVEGPAGFTRWGANTYDQGQGAGHRAVRFSMIFTCAKARDPYPKPGAANKERAPCRG